MIKYVVGFLFDSNRGIVALINKKRGPDSIIGKWNGIGGKVEVGETYLDAMRREFKEEAGLDIGSWEHTITLTGPDFTIQFFRAFSNLVWNVDTIEDEEVAYWVVPRAMVDNQVVPGLKWQIPVQLDNDINYPIEVQVD